MGPTLPSIQISDDPCCRLLGGRPKIRKICGNSASATRTEFKKHDATKKHDRTSGMQTGLPMIERDDRYGGPPRRHATTHTHCLRASTLQLISSASRTALGRNQPPPCGTPRDSECHGSDSPRVSRASASLQSRHQQDEFTLRDRSITTRSRGRLRSRSR